MPREFSLESHFSITTTFSTEPRARFRTLPTDNQIKRQESGRFATEKSNSPRAQLNGKRSNQMVPSFSKGPALDQ